MSTCRLFHGIPFLEPSFELVRPDCLTCSINRVSEVDQATFDLMTHIALIAFILATFVSRTCDTTIQYRMVFPVLLVVHFPPVLVVPFPSAITQHFDRNERRKFF